MNAVDMFSLTGRVALVTGGAQGLGESIARRLASSGVQVVICDVNEQGLKAAASRITTEIPDVKCATMMCDVANESDVIRTMQAIDTQYGHLDIVINNAGVLERGPIEDMELSAWNRLMAVNVTGVFLVAKHAARLMIKKNIAGSIINMASMSGQVVNVPMKQTAYNVSKAAVAMMTKSCAVEWAEYGIRVNALAPGYIRTAMTGPDFETGGQFQHLLQWIPFKRLGEPDELGGAVVWLASEASSYVTGVVLVIDGGYTLI